MLPVTSLVRVPPVTSGRAGVLVVGVPTDLCVRRASPGEGCCCNPSSPGGLGHVQPVRKVTTERERVVLGEREWVPSGGGRVVVQVMLARCPPTPVSGPRVGVLCSIQENSVHFL